MSNNNTTKKTIAITTGSFIWDLIVLFLGALIGYLEFGIQGFIAGLVVSIFLILISLVAFIPFLGIIIYYFVGIIAINWTLALAHLPAWGLTFSFLFAMFGIFGIIYTVLGILVLLIILANI